MKDWNNIIKEEKKKYKDAKAPFSPKHDTLKDMLNDQIPLKKTRLNYIIEFVEHAVVDIQDR